MLSAINSGLGSKGGQYHITFVSNYFFRTGTAGASQAGGGGQGGQCPPDFRSYSPDLFVAPPRNFVGRKKLLVLAEKNARIYDFGQKKPSNLGEDLFLFFFLFLEITCFWAEKTFEFEILARKSLPISAKTFFFGDHLIFNETSPQSNSGIMKKLCPPDFNFAPHRSRGAGDAPSVPPVLF